MRTWKNALVHVACTGLILTGLPGVIMPAMAQQAASAKNDDAKRLMAKAAEQPAIPELPDSPGAIASQSGSGQTAQPAGSQPAPTQSNSAPQGQGQKPVGTAAAESPDTSGIAASQPAGVAIAPAKQRRTRTIILRLGAVIGAGVAVGTVIALTEATGSKPPGAH